MQERNAARVFPAPVGATMSTGSPEWMIGQLCTCTSVGFPKRRPNQVVMMGWKRSRLIPAILSCWFALDSPCRCVYSGKSQGASMLNPKPWIIAVASAMLVLVMLGQDAWTEDIDRERLLSAPGVFVTFRLLTG